MDHYFSYNEEMMQPLKPPSSSSNSSLESTSASGRVSSSESVGSTLSSSGRYEPTSDEVNQVLQAQKKMYDRWLHQEEDLLVQLWAQYHDSLENRNARKYWTKIEEELNKQFVSKLSLNKRVEQCQCKIRYLVEKYKVVKDWNRNQSGGHIRKSLHFDVVDTI